MLRLIVVIGFWAYLVVGAYSAVITAKEGR